MHGAGYNFFKSIWSIDTVYCLPFSQRAFLFLSLGVLLFCFDTGMASSQTSTICIVDAANHQPIHLVSLQCGNINSTTTRVHFEMSDEQGKIASCDCGQDDSLRIIIRHLAYQDIDTTILCQFIPDTIFLNKKDFNIDEVVVTTKNEGIRVKGDSIRFDLRVFIKPHQRDLKDLLNDLPGIEVTKSGQVEYKGKPVGQILLNGKSTARNQFNIINRVARIDDLEAIQLMPEDEHSTDIDRTMNLDIILKPNIRYLVQTQIRKSTELEAEGIASLIRSGDVGLNFVSEASLSQIADPQRPELNVLRELYDRSNKYRRSLKIEHVKSDKGLMSSMETSEEDLSNYALLGLLKESKKSTLDVYARYLGTDQISEYDGLSRQWHSVEPLFVERGSQNIIRKNTLANVSWQLNPSGKWKIGLSSMVSNDSRTVDKLGEIEYFQQPKNTNKNEFDLNDKKASLFGYSIWQPDSSWRVQSGIQVNYWKMSNSYEMESDSAIFDFVLFNNERFTYHLDRANRKLDIAIAIDKLWSEGVHKLSLNGHWQNARVQENGDLNLSAMSNSDFDINRLLFLNTLSPDLHYEFDKSGWLVKTVLGFGFFGLKEFDEYDYSFRGNYNGSINKKLGKDHLLYFHMASTVAWLSDNDIWQSAIPINVKSYNIAGNEDLPVIRTQSYSVGWKEFSYLKGSYSNASISYVQRPTDFQWRQLVRSSYSIDSLVEVGDYAHVQIEMSTVKRFDDLSLSGHIQWTISEAKGLGLWAGQGYQDSDLTLRMGARNLFKSEYLSLNTSVLVHRQSRNFDSQFKQSPIWNAEPAFDLRYFFQSLDLWLNTGMVYLWRGNIYNESIVNASLDKKLGAHFIVTVGASNILNLNQNNRTFQYINNAVYRTTNQSVFGGRIYLKVAYKL